MAALSAYTANLTLKEVVPGTALTLGRTYVSHINTAQIDGGELAVGPDQAHLFVFAGTAGLPLLPHRRRLDLAAASTSTRCARPISAPSISAPHRERPQRHLRGTGRPGLRAGRRRREPLRRVPLHRRPLAARALRLGARRPACHGPHRPYRKLFADIGVDPNQALGFPVSPLTTTLGPYAQYDLVHADVAQPLTKNFLVSAGVD